MKYPEYLRLHLCNLLFSLKENSNMKENCSKQLWKSNSIEFSQSKHITSHFHGQTPNTAQEKHKIILNDSYTSFRQ